MRSLIVALIGMTLVPASVWAQAVPGKPGLAASARPAAARSSLLNPASLKAKAPDVYKVKFATTKGVIVVQVTRAWSPLGADRFYNLVKNGFYDSASFFRVVPGFVVQFGISAKPAVSKAWQAATIKDDPVAQSNHRDYLSFATGGPNTRTTQVFINLRDNTNLDGMGFSPFGQVVEGTDIVDQLYSGYGDDPSMGGSGPDQGRVQNEGKAYLDKDFPKLDSIKSAVVEAPAAKLPAHPAPAAHPGASKKPAPKSSEK